MWPFGGEKLSDPIKWRPYGVTKVCGGCGGRKLRRRYSPDWDSEIGLYPHMEAVCVRCGWYVGEKLKCES